MSDKRVLKLVWRAPCQWCYKTIEFHDKPEPWVSYPCPHCGKSYLEIPDDAEMWQCGCGSTDFHLYSNGCALCVECNTFNGAIRFDGNEKDERAGESTGA